MEGIKLRKILILYLIIFNLIFSHDTKINIDFQEMFEDHSLPRLIIEAETGRIYKANQEAANLYKYPLKTLEQLTIYEINVLEKSKVSKEMEKAKTDNRKVFIFKHRRSDGAIRDVKVYVYPFKIDEKTYFFSIIIDVTEEVRAKARIVRDKYTIIYLSITLIMLLFLLILTLYNSMKKYKSIAFVDNLTGVYTRRLLNKNRLDILLKNTKTNCLVMVDVNNFKQINDNFGHQIGDEVLKRISKIIKDHLREDDLIIRYGGDEFLLIIKESDIEKTEKIMKRIKKSLPNPEKFDFPVDISFGIQLLKENDEIYESIKKADENMYKMKNKKTVFSF